MRWPFRFDRADPWQRLAVYDVFTSIGEVRIQGRKIVYRASGKPQPGALPLILIHGLGVSSAYWGRLLPWLADHRPVYALDLPGFGQSEDPQRVLNSIQLAQAVHEWQQALGIERAHVLAHSQGAQVAAELADAWPETVASLTLVGATLGERDPPLPRMALRLLRTAPREDRTLLPIVARAYLHAGVRLMIRTNLLLSHEDSVVTLGHLTLPALIVRGERDPIVTERAADILAHAITEVRRIIIPGAPHGLHWSHAFELSKIVNPFLAEIDEGQAG
jgi:pimeloyl-ACP methyl ester carboxylesterase